MAYPGLPGGVGRPCAVRNATMAGRGPRAAPASPPKATLKTPTFALSTRYNLTRALSIKHGHFSNQTRALSNQPGAVEPAQLSALLLTLDSCILTIYALGFAILGLLFNGLSGGAAPPIATMNDYREIALTLDTCAAHAVAWGLGAAAAR